MAPTGAKEMAEVMGVLTAFSKHGEGEMRGEAWRCMKEFSFTSSHFSASSFFTCISALWS